MLALALGVPGLLDGQTDSAIDAEISRWTDANVASAHELLQTLVDINSGTGNHEGVREVGAILVDRLAALGFASGWSEVQPDVDRAGHLVALHEGNRTIGGREVLLIGHLDTVFEEGDAFDRFERDGPIARGPGVADMKGGAVVLLYALEALYQVGGLDGAAIRVLYTGDEERVGSPRELARLHMVEAAQASDVVLSFERGFLTDGQPFATVARRGSSGWTLRVSGKQAHSGRIFSEADGVGAINELARIIHEFYAEMAGEEYLTFNVGSMLGGTEVDYDEAAQAGSAFGRTNVIPSTAIARGDLRTISQEQLETARAHMLEIVSQHLPGTSAEITFRDGYPAMWPDEANYRVLEEYSQASIDLGLGRIQPLDPGLRGAGDIAFASDHVEAALDGLGPQGGDTHGPDEWVDLDSFAPQIKRAAMLIYRLTHSER
jgi:glutamate carboxypeptidase